MNKRKIRIKSENCKVELEVEFLANPTAKKILESLPIESRVKRWGDEIYFDTGIVAPVQGARLEVEVGEVCYWPEGTSLCIFFGPTPVSSQDKPVPASAVVVVGRTSPSPELLRKVKPGAKITVE